MQQFQLTPAQQQQILANFPPRLLAQLPLGVRPEQLLAWAANPRQLAAALQFLPLPSGNTLPNGQETANSLSNCGSSAERKQLQPQTKGESPSKSPDLFTTPIGVGNIPNLHVCFIFML